MIRDSNRFKSIKSTKEINYIISNSTQDYTDILNTNIDLKMEKFKTDTEYNNRIIEYNNTEITKINSKILILKKKQSKLRSDTEITNSSILIKFQDSKLTYAKTSLKNFMELNNIIASLLKLNTTISKFKITEDIINFNLYIKNYNENSISKLLVTEPINEIITDTEEDITESINEIMTDSTLKLNIFIETIKRNILLLEESILFYLHYFL